MTKEQALADCHGFDFENSNLSLWTFKKRQGGGFTAKSIEVTDALEAELKRIAAATLATHTEVEDYGLLTQQNEVSCLHVGTDETCFADIKALVDEPAEEHRISTNRDLKGVSGYLIRLRVGTHILYCVKRVTDSWKTKKASSVINVVFRANQMDLVDDQSFTISKNFDFVVLDNDLLVLNKRTFESLLSYKAEYANAFGDLQQDGVFSGCFTDLQPLIDHIGTNTMHLRRMAVIRQRAHYADAGYMQRLREVNDLEGWQIQFDANGRIIATEEAMTAIMQALLNHRLYSRLSLTTFDVPSSAAVQAAHA